MSCFVSFGDKSWDNFKNFFQTQDVEFSFLSPKGASSRLWRLDSAENARFETQPPFSLQVASCNRRRINAGGLRAVRKTPGRDPSPFVGKVSSLRWLTHELANQMKLCSFNGSHTR